MGMSQYKLTMIGCTADHFFTRTIEREQNKQLQIDCPPVLPPAGIRHAAMNVKEKNGSFTTTDDTSYYTPAFLICLKGVDVEV